MRRLLAALLLPLLLTVPAAAADGNADRPPKVLMLDYETIRPGTSGAHDKVAAGFVALAVKAKLHTYWLGLAPVTGDQNTSLFLTGFPSFAAVEEARKADDAAMAASAALRAESEKLEKAGAGLHVSQRSMLASYQEELSYRPPTDADIGKSRYMEIVVTRVRPGHIPEYVEFMKAANQGREKAKSDLRLVVFQVSSGAQAGTFVIVRPIASLKELDADGMKAFVAAVGEESWKKMRALYAEIVEESTRTLFAFNPKTSNPVPSISSADPAFWKPKP